MAWKPNRTCCLYARVVVGVYLMMVVNSLACVWGNLSIYTMSYLHFRSKDELVINSSWAISLSTMAWSLGMMSCGKLVWVLGFRITMVAVGLGFSTCVGLCSVLVRYSFMALVFTIAGMGGFFYGVGHGVQLKLVTMWIEPRYLGFACCSILSTQQAGGAIMNLIITYYINPENVGPNRHVLKLNLFSQPEVLDRVPSVFLIYGVICLVLASVSFVLVKLKPQKDTVDEQQGDTPTNNSHKVTYEVTGSTDIQGTSDDKVITNRMEQGKSPTNNCHKVMCHVTGSTDVQITDDNVITNGMEQGKSPTNNCHKVMSYVTGSTDVQSTDDIVITNGMEQGKSPTNICQDVMYEVTGNTEPQGTDDNVIINEMNRESMGRKDRTENGSINTSHCIPHPSDRDGGREDNYKTLRLDQTLSETTQLNTDKGARGSNSESVNKIHGHTRISTWEITPKQALKTKTFYTLFTMVACSDVAFIITITYFKVFGMIYYPDDHFFTNTAVALNVSTFLAINISGLASDRFDVKNTTVANTWVMAALSCFVYLSIHVNKWFYGAWIVLYGGSLMSTYCLVSVCALKYFGDSHGTTIYGMAMMASYVTNTSMPFLIRYILYAFGWFELHIIGSVFTVVCLFAVVLGLE